MRASRAGWLPDYALAFHYRSKARGGGALDIVERRGSTVAGMLFDVDARDRELLDQKEGAPERYRAVDVVVLDHDGAEHDAFSYVVTDAHRTAAHVPPTDAYLRLVRAGLDEHGLDATGLSRAAAGRARGSYPDALFVYGTLMRGESRRSILERFDPIGTEPATISGRLLDLGAYPGLVEGEDVIAGELVRFETLESLLETLDDIEDFVGYGADGSLFRRIVRSVGGDPAWTYIYAGEGRARIASGDWRRRALGSRTEEAVAASSALIVS